jgi:DNA polymerase-3 subunit gamma/tau
VNNAALERLSSITERVQARPAAAALEKRRRKRSLSLEIDDGC